MVTFKKYRVMEQRAKPEASRLTKWLMWTEVSNHRSATRAFEAADKIRATGKEVMVLDADGRAVVDDRVQPDKKQKARRKHSRNGSIRCEICAPARCSKARDK
jgi:hypothetical protein